MHVNALIRHYLMPYARETALALAGSYRMKDEKPDVVVNMHNTKLDSPPSRMVLDCDGTALSWPFMFALALWLQLARLQKSVCRSAVEVTQKSGACRSPDVQSPTSGKRSTSATSWILTFTPLDQHLLALDAALQ